MKAQMKAIMASAVVIALCLAAVGGVTYSWFTDSENSEIQISAGSINLDVSVSSVKVKSVSYGELTVGTDPANPISTSMGGKIYYSISNESDQAYLTINFNNAAPGDYVTINAARTLTNTIHVVYSEELETSVKDGDNWVDAEDSPFTVLGLIATPLTHLTTDDSNISSDPIIVKMNEGAGNEYQNKSYKIVISFEAVQSNYIPENVTQSIPQNPETSTTIDVLNENNGAAVSIELPATAFDSAVSFTAKAVDECDPSSPSYSVLSNMTILGGVDVVIKDSEGNTASLASSQTATVKITVDGTYSQDAITIYHESNPIENSQITSVDATTIPGKTIITFNASSFSAYYAIDNSCATIGSKSYGSLEAAVADAPSDSIINISKDINNITCIGLNSSKIVTIDLCQNVLSFSDAAFCTTNSSGFIIKNGSINTHTAADKAAFYAENGGFITVDNVTINGDSGSVFLPLGNASAINILNSKVTTNGYYAVGTNAKSPEHYGISIVIKNSDIETSRDSDHDNTAVMINVSGTLNISDSKIKADRQCLIVRAGTATVDNTEFIYTALNQTEKTSSWGSGNEVVASAIVVGNIGNKDSYKAPASLTLSGSILKCNNNNAKALVVAQDGSNGQTATITINNEPTTSEGYRSIIADIYLMTSVNTFNKVEPTEGTINITLPAPQPETES